SAAILAFVVRRLSDARVGVLLTLRAGTERDPLELEAALPAESRERVSVGPLSLAALHQLFLTRLERSFPRLILIKVERMSGGNRFYALEIARALDRAGGPLDPGEELPVPRTLAALTDERLAALPERTRDALAHAAADAEPTLDLLADAGFAEPRHV